MSTTNNSIVERLERVAANFHKADSADEVIVENYKIPNLAKIKERINDFDAIDVKEIGSNASPNTKIKDPDAYIKIEIDDGNCERGFVIYCKDPDDSAISNRRNILIEFAHAIINYWRLDPVVAEDVSYKLPVDWYASCTGVDAESSQARYLAEAILIPKNVFKAAISENTYDGKFNLLKVAETLNNKHGGGDETVTDVFSVKERGIQLGLWER